MQNCEQGPSYPTLCYVRILLKQCFPESLKHPAQVSTGQTRAGQGRVTSVGDSLQHPAAAAGHLASETLSRAKCCELCSCTQDRLPGTGQRFTSTLVLCCCYYYLSHQRLMANGGALKSLSPGFPNM